MSRAFDFLARLGDSAAIDRMLIFFTGETSGSERFSWLREMLLSSSNEELYDVSSFMVSTDVHHRDDFVFVTRC